MKRGGPLRRGVPIQRSRMTYTAKQDEVDRAERTIIRERVFARDNWLCQLRRLDPSHDCQRSLMTPHHLLKASQGGEYTMQNLITLCAVGNDWVEDNPNAAWRLGLVVRHGETLEDAAERRRQHGA